MIQKDKQLLLKDLCARLPYYTELYSNAADGNWAILTPVVISNLINADKDLVIKPYLRPMSSMTEEEENKYRAINCYEGMFPHNEDALDYVLEHHLDFRDLIPMGLALEAPDDMYKI